MLKIRPFLVNIALFCLVGLFLTVAAEAAFRMAGLESPGYVTREIYGNVNLLYRPNSRTRWRGNLGQALEFDTPIQTNSLSQFDREHAMSKPAGTYRVIVAGDSFVEVIKFGGSGNGAIKTYEAVHRSGFQYQPDLVLGFFTDSNDFKDDWHHFRRQTGKEVYQHVNLRPQQALYDKVEFYKKWIVFPASRLNRWIAFKVTQWHEKGRQQRENEDHWKETLGVYAVPGSARFADEADKWDEAFRLTAAGHFKMNSEASSHGAQYAVVLNDRPQTYRSDAYEYLFKLIPGLKKEVDLDLPAKRIKAFLSRNGVGWLDLNDSFKTRLRHRQTGHYKYDGHWNEDGHRWTTEALVPFVKARMLGGK